MRKASAPRMSAPLRTRNALITLAPVRRATSRQNCGPSSPWSWTIVELLLVRGAGDLVERRVDEDAGDLAAALQRRADLGRDLGLDERGLSG